MDAEELSDADDELRSRPCLSLRLGAGTADAEDAIVSASRFSSYSFRFTPLHYLLLAEPVALCALPVMCSCRISTATFSVCEHTVL